MPTYDIRRLVDGMRLLFSESQIEQLLLEAADEVGLAAQQLALDTYPPRQTKPAAGYSPLHTPKQWRWWWAMMNKIARKEPGVPDSLRGWKASYKIIGGHKTLSLSGQYRRTGTLVRSITYEVTAGPNRVDVAVGPGLAREGSEVAEYAQYVLDRPAPQGHQARVHQGRWTPLVDLLERHQGELYDIFEEALVAGLQRKMRELL